MRKKDTAGVCLFLKIAKMREGDNICGGECMIRDACVMMMSRSLPDPPHGGDVGKCPMFPLESHVQLQVFAVPSPKSESISFISSPKAQVLSPYQK